MVSRDDDALYPPERGELGEETVQSHRAPSPDDDRDDDPIREAPPPMAHQIRPAEILARATRLRLHPDITVDDPDDANTMQVTEESLLDTALHAAHHTIAVNEAECERLRAHIAALDEATSQARTIVADIEARRLAQRG